MIEISLREIVEAIGAKPNDAAAADLELLVSGSVETDSRLVGAGSLFFAKPGEVTDGHLFVSASAKAGAVASVVEHLVDDASDHPQLVVQNVVEALGLLAKHVLAVLSATENLKVIGITGSNGKTTTKNMLREILATAGETIAPIESYNNEVGAPISMLKASHDTRFLVVEMGAGGLGSIAYLADIAKPNIGVVLKVGLAHVGEFGGIETTAKIKAELPAALGDNDIFVYNADDGYVRDMVDLNRAKKVSFGTAGDSQYRATDLNLSIDGTSFEMHWPDAEISKVTLKILGEHHVMNALASLTVGDQLGVDRTKAIAALESMELAERWRMQVSHRSDGVTIINDAYNASPDSTRAALQTLAQLGKTGRRTIAILGEMAELGHASRTEHDAIGRVVVRLNIDQLVVVGEGARLIHSGAVLEGSWDGESLFFDEIDQALEAVREMLEPGDIVLVKSSKSANLRHLGDKLMEVRS
jgi:UDP-N-acetylmuramoyl-tripeptide--D-alanyl-D-alanine ligase